MKSICAAILAVLVAGSACGQDSPSVEVPTPAEQKIAEAVAAIKDHPERSQPYNDLALGYLRRARETGDARYNDSAETALERSLQLAPDNFEGQKTQVMILLGRSEFRKALNLATSLNKQTPDDVLVYGFIADADIELGNYKGAEEAAQWMLDIRPGNVPGLLRGARLRGLFGDVEGSMDFYSQAYQQTPPTQTEDQAWILTKMADLQLTARNPDDAEKLVHSALQKFPGYYLALECQARVRAAQQSAAETTLPAALPRASQ